jgi:Na+/proline symporter
MALVALLLAGAALATVGGPSAAVAMLEQARPELLGSFGSAPPARALAWYLLFCVGTCAQPHYLQKFFFLRSSVQLRHLPAILTLALVVMLTVWLGLGLAGTSLAVGGNLAVGSPDELAPRTLAALGPWAELLAGVAILAALMSTAASFLNLAAAAVTRDLPGSLGRPSLGLPAARITTVAVALAAVGLGVGSGRTVAVLGIGGWGFFTAALLPAFTFGLAWNAADGRAVASAIVVGALVDIALETVRASLPPGLEPGLAGAALGTVVLVALSWCRRAAPAGGGEVGAHP